MSEKASLTALPACDWAALESVDRRYWADEYARDGAATSLHASAALRQHMRSVRADWPTAAERDADLRHHVHTQRLLARVARVTAR
jgi:hypothetical protein